MAGEIESKDQDTDEGKITTSWLRELSLSSAHEEKWRKRAKKVIDRYRDEASDEEDNRKSRFNILFSNTEVLRGVIYQKSPIPDVRRRFLDRDPVGREAAQVLQRALAYCADSYDFDGVMAGIVEDYLLPGRGVAKVKYIPSYAPMQNEETGEPLMDAESGEPVQEVVYETVETEYVEWEMFRMSPAKRWSKVRWVAFGELLTRDELKAQFGKKGQKCTLDWKPKDKEEENDDMFKRALVWSIWDKTSKKVHVVCKGLSGERLAVKDDPLNLEQFFPCPKPVYSIKNTNTMIPVPEYAQYQDQAIELDNLTARIEALTDGLRRRGVYDAAYPELAKLASAGDDEFVPIEKFVNLAEKGGLAAALYESPIEGIAKVLVQLMDQREAVKQIIYEVTGIADIVRGVSNSSETLGAQELKARYANSRTGPRQKDIQIFARDLYRLKAEIISEKFSPQTLAVMTGFDLAQNDAEKQALQTQAQAMQGQQPPDKLNKPTWEQITKILRDDKLRGFRVDIETDSTVMPDAATEQKNRIELLTAISGFVTGIAPAVQSGAIPMDLAREMLTFGVRAFKVSPQLEDALDQIGGEKEAGQSQQAQQQMQMQQQAMQQQVQEAQQAIAEQQKQAEAVIQQAKDAKQQADNQLLKASYEDKLKSAMNAVEQRDAALAQREAEMQLQQQTQDAVRQLQQIVDGFTQQLNATASAEAKDDTEEEDKPDQMAHMQQMHNEVMQAFAALVERVTAPRQRTAIRGQDGRMTGSIETIQDSPTIQ
jgi:hypothetical protein